MAGSCGWQARSPQKLDIDNVNTNVNHRIVWLKNIGDHVALECKNFDRWHKIGVINHDPV
jgi:hypothetical protein